MPSHASVKSKSSDILRGRSDGARPSLAPTPATLDRPEGRRRYLIAAPSGPAAGKRALVLVLHGAGASAAQVLGQAFPPSPLSVLLDIAARENVVVIAPDAGKGGWSDCFAAAARVARKDDAGVIDALIERAIAGDAGGRTRVTRFMWGPAPDGLQVGLSRIDGGGHAEPSRLKRYPRFLNWLTGLQNADLKVAEAAWAFFRTKRANRPVLPTVT